MCLCVCVFRYIESCSPHDVRLTGIRFVFLFNNGIICCKPKVKSSCGSVGAILLTFRAPSTTSRLPLISTSLIMRSGMCPVVCYHARRPRARYCVSTIVSHVLFSLSFRTSSVLVSVCVGAPCCSWHRRSQPYLWSKICRCQEKMGQRDAAAITVLA